MPKLLRSNYYYLVIVVNFNKFATLKLAVQSNDGLSSLVCFTFKSFNLTKDWFKSTKN